MRTARACLLVVVLAFVVVAAGCGASTTPTSAPGAAPSLQVEMARMRSLQGVPPAPDLGPLAAVDWRNRSYTITLRGEASQRFDVVDGEARLTSGTGDEETLIVGDEPATVYGDLTGDGVAEAVVQAHHWRDGYRYLDVVLLFAADGDDAVMIGALPEGLRGDGDIRTVAVEDRVLRVERFIDLPTPPGTDPETVLQHERWRWDGNGLVEDVGARERGPVPPMTSGGR